MKATASTKQTPVSELVQHPDNPRHGHLPAIKASIEKNGWFGAIIAQKSTNHVLAGNHRLQAARELGIEEVPVIYLDVDDTRAKAILLADNRTNDLAVYDDEALTKLLAEVNENQGDLEGTGWSPFDLDRLLNELNAEPPDWKDPEDGIEEKLEEARENAENEGLKAVICPECGHTVEL